MTAIDPAGLDRRRALLDAWVEKRRRITVLEAEASSLLAERMLLTQADAADHPFHRETIHRSMVAEYAAAGRLSTGSMEHAFTDASFLHRRHPGVLAAFRSGAITVAHVRAIVREAGIVREAVMNDGVDAEALAAYDTAAVVIAERESPARASAHLRALAAALARATVTERHARARAERTVEMRSVGDGLALLTVVLPEHLAVAVMDRLTQLARGVTAARGRRGSAPGDRAIFGDDTFTVDPLHEAVTGAGTEPLRTDDRTLDQVRADVLSDLLLAATPSSALGGASENVQARIQVTVAATTLAGLDDRPAELDGHGPLHPDIARDLAGRNNGWSRLFLDATGLVTATDTYTPTEPMRRFLRARDQHCRFPGCRMPAHRCQVDHTHDHAKGGRTEVHNLAHLCATHHVLKHPDIADDHRWTARQLPDGTIDWISPLGRSYRDAPPRRVMFA